MEIYQLKSFATVARNLKSNVRPFLPWVVPENPCPLFTLQTDKSIFF
jgi:hypothetical protein